MSKEHYDRKLKILKAIPKKAVKRPRIPIDTYLQEAQNRYIWVKEDKAILIKKINFDWVQYGEDLPVRAGALSHAQSLWIKELRSQGEVKKQWNKEFPIARKFRDDLLNDLKYAFEDNKTLSNTVKAIRKGNSHANTIQDLFDLSVFGKAHIELLQKVNFEEEKLSRAETVSKKMASLLAKVHEEVKKTSKTKDLRDRAYIHLKEAMDKLNRAGKYTFKDNPDRYRGYINHFLKK